MKIEFECKKCHSICMIDGTYPRFFCFCDTCRDYADGFNDEEYAADYLGNQMDAAVDYHTYED